MAPKKMPAGEATPLGTTKTRTRKASDVATSPTAQRAKRNPKKVVDTPTADSVNLSSDKNASEETHIDNNLVSGVKHMLVHFVLNTKQRKSKKIVFVNAAKPSQAVTFTKSCFGDVAPPTEISIDSSFAEAKAKLTAEERKEVRKNAPKLTPAEKLAKLRERTEKLQAKIDAANAAPAQS